MKELFNLFSNVSNFLNEKRFIFKGPEGPKVTVHKTEKGFKADEVKLMGKKPKTAVKKAKKTVSKAEKLRSAEKEKYNVGKALSKIKNMKRRNATIQIALNLEKAVGRIMKKGGAENAKKALSMVTAVENSIVRATYLKKRAMRASGEQAGYMSVSALEATAKKIMQKYEKPIG